MSDKKERNINIKNYYDKKHPLGTEGDPLIKRYIRFFKEGSVLDLGGGDGRNAVFFAENGFDVTNVDITAKALETFKETIAIKNLQAEAIECNIRDFKYPQKYDNIVCVSTLHFLKKGGAKKVIEEMKKNTSEGGFNLIMAFMRSNENDRLSNFFFVDKNELLEMYLDWKIVSYIVKKSNKYEGGHTDVAFIFAQKK